MELIHFEKQEGMLCAQHALNALLQGPYFTVLDLAEIAKSIDDAERQVLSAAGVQAESENLDDSGYFSVQVIEQALQHWNLALLPYNSSDECAVQARLDPTKEMAYICNFQQHWFTIRKIGLQWFNLNSNFARPEYVSETFLSLLLSQLQTEGYSIFIVRGALPQCEADPVLTACPVDPSTLPQNSASSRTNRSLSSQSDPDIAEALRKSKAEAEGRDPSLQQALSRTRGDIEDDGMSEALARSIAEQEEEHLRQALAMSLNNADTVADTTSASTSSSTSNDEEKLKKALALSLDGATDQKPSPKDAPKSTEAANGDLPGDGRVVDPKTKREADDTASNKPPDPADLRAKRAAFLDKMNK